MHFKYKPSLRKQLKDFGTQFSHSFYNKAVETYGEKFIDAGGTYKCAHEDSRISQSIQ